MEQVKTADAFALAKRFVARFLAATYRRGRHHEEDLIQEAAIAALEAIKTYDATKGATIETWAHWKMRAAVNQYLDRNMGSIQHGTKGERAADSTTDDTDANEPSHDPTEDVHNEIASKQVQQRLADAASSLSTRSDAPRAHSERMLHVFEVLNGSKTAADMSRELGVSRQAANRMVAKYRPIVEGAREFVQ